MYSTKMRSVSRSEESTPICRCRVLYLGSAVPHVTKDGLQGIQEPLRELYPEQGAVGARGIDSWLSVWSNGLLLENVDENYKKVTRFFPIDSLHYCAAVRYVLVPEKLSPGANSQPRFLPLDSPFARSPNPNHPPLFAAILRRTTGIKVLECHTFICKREMAANALVRCCFHAYADSSYAKQIGNGGVMSSQGVSTSGSQINGGESLYGTLCNSQPMTSNSIEKVEGWRRMQPSVSVGSTLTLNSAVHATTSKANQENGMNGIDSTLSNSVDDMFICNGNENHKVWAGSNRDLTEKEASHTECSTMRSSRSNRPRQITNAVPPPPPPAPSTSSKEDKSRRTKDRGRRKKLSEGSRDDLYCNGNRMLTNGYAKAPSSVSGGTVMRGYPPSKVYPPLNNAVHNGTILRPAAPMNGFHPMHYPVPHTPPMIMVPTTLPHPPRHIPTGSYNKKKHAPILVPVVPRNMIPTNGPLPPNLVPIGPQPIYVQTSRKISKKQMPIMVPIPPAIAQEEPIYMPSARPMSPIASYQPAHFPHETYLMQQYASSIDPKTKKKKNKKKETRLTNGKQGSTRTSHLSLNHHAPNLVNGHANEGEEDDDIDLDEDNSTYNTGIYKRKGHLNERAFSYSIRQEQRSRSYGSLANLKFAPSPIVPNGVNKEQIKKEREIMQMMRDLDLSGDELERSEVPSGIYQPAKHSVSNKVRR